MKTSQVLTLTLAAAVAAATNAAAVRNLGEITVVEGTSGEVPSENAVSVRSSNPSVASVSAPDGATVSVSGVRIGRAELTYLDALGPRATRTVSVVPAYWATLLKFFEDDPEVSVSVGGDKIILAGVTANPDTLRRARQATSFDSSGRIVNQVTSSTPAVADLVSEYLRELGRTNIVVAAVGHEICLSGKLYDAESIKLVGDRVKEFLKDFEGIGVNTDGLKVIKQRISLAVELLQYDTGKARNLGLKTPDQISGKINAKHGFDFTRTRTGAGKTDHGQAYYSEGRRGYEWSREVKSGTEGGTTETSNRSLSDSLTRTLNDTISSGNALDTVRKATFQANAELSDMTVTVNLLKQNSVGKTVYHTTLSTQSGEEVEFQNGGTIHRNTQGTYTSDVKEIEYGFIVKAKPVIIDSETMALDISLDNKSPTGFDGSSNRDIDVKRYQTRSKYVVRPGESIALSGFNQVSQSQTKDGTPLLSRIPWIGRLFQNVSDSSENTEMALIVTVNWVTEDETAAANAARAKIADRKAEIEAP